MQATSSHALPVAHVVLRILIIMNWLMGAAILALLVAMPNEQWIMSAFKLSPSPDAERLVMGLRAVALLGLVVILTAGTFGTINSSPWFNLAIAALFIVLGLAMFDVIDIDFSRFSGGMKNPARRGTFGLAFVMGAVAALLAGACVAPVVIQVVLFASSLYAGGTSVALALADTLLFAPPNWTAALTGRTSP